MAIKFKKNGDPTLLQESRLQRMLTQEQQIVRIPEYIEHGYIEVKENGAKYNYLAMEYIDESINDYLDKPEE